MNFPVLPMFGTNCHISDIMATLFQTKEECLKTSSAMMNKICP